MHQPDSIGLLQLAGCHLLHWSGEHLFWDLAMFVVLGAICERWLPRAFTITLLVCTVAIPLAVFWAHPNIDVYRGLSGLDTAIFSLLATALWLRSRPVQDHFQEVVCGLLLVALWSKIILEFQSGQVLFVQQVDFVPLPIAHAVGGLVGSVVALWSAPSSRSFPFPRSPNNREVYR